MTAKLYRLKPLDWKEFRAGSWYAFTSHIDFIVEEIAGTNAVRWVIHRRVIDEESDCGFFSIEEAKALMEQKYQQYATEGFEEVV